MTYDLYLFLPFLKYCEHVDTTDTQYINQSIVYLVNPLQITLHIELYNEKWFETPFQTLIQFCTYPYDTLKLSNKCLLLFQSVVELHDETNTCSPQSLIEKVDDTISKP